MVILAASSSRSQVRVEMAKVLIADDSRFQRQMMASCLFSRKFEIIYAADTLQTCMLAMRSNPDLILLDINMPGGTGIEVLKRLRVSMKTQQIPIIVVSGDQNPETESAARKLGAFDFLHKPVDLEKLSQSVDRALGLPAANSS
jgi:CheY-like chemotaxis protein